MPAQKIEGTNHGGFTFDLTQDNELITGIVSVSEPALGQYKYKAIGKLTDKRSFLLELTPAWQSGGIDLGTAKVIATSDGENSLRGKWQTTIGTEGVFTANRFNQDEMRKKLPKKNSVFIVHGHDEGLKQAVARFLEKIGINPVILQEQISNGMTLIEKFEDFADLAGFAVVLMTPDDFGYPKDNEQLKKYRPRQNVIFELGYFLAKLGREKTIVLTKGDLELLSDFSGVVYEPVSNDDGWKFKLAKELKSAGFEVDLNKAL
jgi:predicted nucleotide-binding protein